jgi:hypothetical protein
LKFEWDCDWLQVGRKAHTPLLFATSSAPSFVCVCVCAWFYFILCHRRRNDNDDNRRHTQNALYARMHACALNTHVDRRTCKNIELNFAFWGKQSELERERERENKI